MCIPDTSDELDVKDIQNHDSVLCTRHPQLFEHQEDDVPYIEYFLTQVKAVLPYFEIFPRMPSDVFSRATENQGLFHTVLSVSHLVADSRLHRSLVPAFYHQQQALALLQKSISATDITETLAISVAMLAWLNMLQCNRAALSQHLHGLYLIFQEIQHRCLIGTGASPLLMQIWRFSIRLDLIATTLFFPRTPLFPAVPINQDHLHRDWISLSTPTDQDTEWALASFALDNLMHRTSHVAMKAYELRRQTCNSESQILASVSALLMEHAQWLNRDIVMEAERYERKANEEYSLLLATCCGQFLDYPSLRIYNTFYGNLLNTWRAIYILIDLIIVPQIGPAQRRKRFQYAIDICRTYAALGRDDMFALGKVTSVFLCGVALGGKRTCPKETGWLQDCMVESLQEYFPLNREGVVCHSNWKCADLIRLNTKKYGK